MTKFIHSCGGKAIFDCPHPVALTGGEGVLCRFSSARPNKNLKQDAFSLLEVLVAFSILALCLGVLLRVFSGDGRLAGLAEEHTRAVVLAESLLAGAGVESPLQPGQFSGVIDDKFSWVMNVSPFVPPEEALPENQPFKPYWVDLTVAWGEANEPRSFTLSTLRLVGDNRSGPGSGFGLTPR